MPDLLPHLRRELHELECLAARHRAKGSPLAEMVDRDVAVMDAKVDEAERDAKEVAA